MIDYIRSGTVRDYLKENEIVLQDKMIAALICGHPFETEMEEVHKSLKELQMQTEDEELKRQIRVYIEDDLANLREFREAGTGDIYKLSVWDEGAGDYKFWEYYKESELAEYMARALKKKCKIEKHYVVQKNDGAMFETAFGGRMYYRADGKLCFAEGTSEYHEDHFCNNILFIRIRIKGEIS